ncbi:PEGA domain-containing protein [candidate division CSSED10-310 bacterium]|uniref:PEGA domain-containing protein n=1 Tax=candidate division CSSED10-310 bacterium TaxID=2855610 RepID=A0ABV6YT15_UNCC1
MRICRKCQTENDEAALFCVACGEDLEDVTERETDQIVLPGRFSFNKKLVFQIGGLWLIVGLLIGFLVYHFRKQPVAEIKLQAEPVVTSVLVSPTPTEQPDAQKIESAVPATTAETVQTTSPSPSPTVIPPKKTGHKSLAQTPIKADSSVKEVQVGRKQEEENPITDEVVDHCLILKVSPDIEILIDDQRIEKNDSTEQARVKLTPGFHNVTLTDQQLWGFHTTRVKVAGETHLNYVFRTGLLSVSSEPAGLLLQIDEHEVGKTPRENIKIATGKHTLAVSCPGGVVTREITIYEGRIRKVEISCP